MSLRATGALFVFASLMAACSSSSSNGDAQGGATDGGAGGGEIDPETGLPRCKLDGTDPDRCVDNRGAVHCPLHTGYPGDELALCEPDPAKGMLLHYGPTNHDDPAEMAMYYIEPSVEDENCMFAHTPNTTDRLITNYHGRMRPNSHHLIVTTLDAEVQDSTVPGKCTLTDAVGARWLVGSQDPTIDIAIGGLGAEDGADEPKPTDPDFGLAQTIGANTPIRLDLHYVNTDSEQVLREAWVSFDYVDEAVKLVDMITLFQGSIDVPPLGSFTTAQGKCTVDTDRYVGLLTGHAHRALTRETVWKEDLAGVRTRVYETYDWFEPGNLYYRDGLENPVPRPDSKAMGGSTGYLPLKAGESLIFECAYQNQTNGPLALGETTNDEMCNVFGMYYPTNGKVWSCTCLGDQCFGGKIGAPAP